MGVMDELKFTLKTELARVDRLNKAALTAEASPSDKNKKLLQVMAERMDDHYSVYVSTVQKIVAHNAKNNIAEDLGPDVEKYEAEYFNAKSILVSFFPTDRADQLNLSADQTASAVDEVRRGMIQMPKIKLPEFSGDIKGWQYFSELFNNMVHQNRALSNHQRHIYLRSALSGEAQALVASLPITESNYASCWDTLCQRYDNTHLQTNAHLEAIFSLPITSNNAATLRKFAGALTESAGALKALGHDVEGWAVPILYMSTKRLHAQVRELWERSYLERPNPRLVDFTNFLYDQARVLEVAYPSSTGASGKPPYNLNKKPSSSKSALALLTDTRSPTCAFCDGLHRLDMCGKFRTLPTDARFKYARDNHLCLSCLGKGHFRTSCARTKPCKHCTGTHHSLLHFKKESNDDAPTWTPSNSQSEEPKSSNQVQAHHLRPAMPNSRGQIVLATACAHVQAVSGQYLPVRLLIDPASETTFITEACVARLMLRTTKADVAVMGMGQTTLGICTKQVRCLFKPARGIDLQIDALVVPRITVSPSAQLQPLPRGLLKGKPLADPEYFRPAEVDILLGAEWFGTVMLSKPIEGKSGIPCFIESIWGYCLIGRVSQAKTVLHNVDVMMQETGEPSLEQILQKFWELEEPPSVKIVSPSDKECEEHYVSTVSRDQKGRFIVRLPFKPLRERLGDSRQAALRRFQLLERRFIRNPRIHRHYINFMQDIMDQGHMGLATTPPRPSDETYYIPHHCILREAPDGEIEKFRVVFDSSMPTKNGPSLNRILQKGPKLQADILDLLIGFRLHEVVLIGDIRQCYRNIMMHQDDWDYQRIFWRASLEEPVREYWLKTVVYGVAPSAFLAIRTLHQTVADHGADYPLAASAIMTSTYMDDIVTSVPTIALAIRLKDELIALLGAACFELRKWVSNRKEVLDALPEEHCALSANALAFQEEEEPTAKILGLIWHPTTDVFSYRIHVNTQAVTKRTVSSDIARLYDPCGFVCPVIFVGKCLLRELWQSGRDWDDQVPKETARKWLCVREELPLLERIALPRCFAVSSTMNIQIHGFADSSEQGFAGVVYLREITISGDIRTHLVLAKSKVAPMKTQSLPRLELCAVELTSRLVERTQELISPHAPIASVVIWTDSMVALHWMQSSPHRWKTFVANRVSAAQQRVPAGSYRHVPTVQNPADCASRGLMPSDILSHTLWWNGPEWLRQPEQEWPTCNLVSAGEETEAKVTALATVTTPSVKFDVQSIAGLFSSFTVLVRVVAWMLRFIHNRVVVPSQGREVRSGQLSMTELRAAQRSIIRLVQCQHFPLDIKRLSANQLPSKPLRRLGPFLDEAGIMRVGGRINRSLLPYEQKFPAILPKDHPFTNLLIDHYHKLYLHTGVTHMRALIGREYWILNAQSAVRKRLSKCIECFRARPHSQQPMMGDLPKERVTPSKPFSVVGVDYGGPLEITMSRIRNAKTLKAYICLFVCFSTKAIHLELASDLTTECFLAALRRFVARRGSVAVIHSDCGTNFVGAKRKLETWDALVGSREFNDAATRFLSHWNVTWRLSPPASPNFNGLMEAGIKSTKKLLIQTIGSQRLTYEELNTVLTQVEATLNSRPLVPMSADVEDVQALTPGHFLMMEAPSALTDPEVPPTDRHPRDRWTLLRQLVASFWKRWSKEYLNSLQHRPKWTAQPPNLEEGALVIIKEDNLAPLQWHLGRITRLFPGEDHIARVAEVRTATGRYRRRTAQLCPLPIN